MQTNTQTDSAPVPAEGRRPAVVSLLRSLLVSAVIVVGYFVLPLTSPFAADSLIELTAGLGVIAALLTWQVRGVVRSRYPGVRAIGALAVSTPLFLVLFATTYYMLGSAEPSMFSEPMTRLDSLYFTITTFATVGFGDITAVSQPARALTMIQMVGDLVLVGIFARVVFGAVQEGRSRQRPGRRD